MILKRILRKSVRKTETKIVRRIVIGRRAETEIGRKAEIEIGREVRIGNETAIIEIVIGTVAENVVRKENVREMIWMMIIIVTEVVTGTHYCVCNCFSGCRLFYS